jgi:hypothetical protein
VVDELVGVPACCQAGHRYQAAFLRCQLLSLPDLTEQDVIGEVHEGGREVAEHLLSARGWLFSVV